MDWLLSSPVAHRGLHRDGGGPPENSLGAFEAARDARYPVELDVRLLRDGAAAVFHDENLLRLTGVDQRLALEDSLSICKRRLAGSGETIPLLGEALDVIGGRVPVLIEVKNFDVPGPLEAAVLSEIERYPGPCAVQSFNPFSMGWFRVKAPDVVRGHLSGGFAGMDLDESLRNALRSLELVDVSVPAFVGYDIRYLPFAPVATLRRRCMPVIGWTVRSPAERSAALEHCDNYIFEHIDPARGS